MEEERRERAEDEDEDDDDVGNSSVIAGRSRNIKKERREKSRTLEVGEESD
jgi:hypothetical protein